MTHPSQPTHIRTVAHLDLRFERWAWPFAETRRADIDSHFARLRQDRPQLWNGRVLLARDCRFSADTFHARYFETDFASFIAWRDWGFPDTQVYNAFGMGALRGSDGGFVLGEMAAHTANAGKVYFPSGTPDPSDLRDGLVDIAGSVGREVMEETGIGPSDYTPTGQWVCVMRGQLAAMIRRLDAPATSAALQSRIAHVIAAQHDPELSATHLVHDIHDLSPAMPDFVAAYLGAYFTTPSVVS